MEANSVFQVITQPIQAGQTCLLTLSRPSHSAFCLVNKLRNYLMGSYRHRSIILWPGGTWPAECCLIDLTLWQKLGSHPLNEQKCQSELYTHLITESQWTKDWTEMNERWIRDLQDLHTLPKISSHFISETFLFDFNLNEHQHAQSTRPGLNVPGLTLFPYYRVSWLSWRAY